VETLIEFGRGALFRFAVAIAVLGLLRHAILSVVGFIQTRRRIGDKRIRLGDVLASTALRLNPVKYFIRNRWYYSILSVTFHVGLLLVPIFFLGHIRLWRRGLGLGWPSLPALPADILTIATMLAAVLLVAGRAWTATSRAISRTQDWLLPPAIFLAFCSGFLIAHPAYFPAWLSLRLVLFVHVWLCDLLLIATPFTKIVHCALLPFSQLAVEMAWRMVPGAGQDVVKTLGKEEQPI
jgi:hypothetical protein